jgi:RNA polymerase sigma-70 factor (ECF subfamily)
MGDKSIDQALVERVQQGDKSAFDILVRKYQHKVAKVIARYIRDQDEVMDVSQEAFIKAYRALPNFRGDSAFYTWIYRIAINTAKNHLVARKRRLPTIDVDIQDAEQFDGESALKEYATPEQLLQRDQVESTVLKAVDQLPDDLRTAITLREIDGMSYEEIAEAMDCPVGTVRSRIFRAREAVDKMLRPVMGSN